MKAEEVQAGQLFDSGQQLLVPIWQRRYTWDRQEWRELWKDLQHLRSTPETTTHFIGSIVLKALPWRGLPSEAKRYWIVDGQQRAITLTLLAAAIRDRLARLAGTDDDRVEVSRAYTDQLFRNASLKEDHRDRLVLQAQDASRLNPLVNSPVRDLSDAPIDRAYEFFAQVLEDLTASELEDLLSILLVRLMAVWVVLDENDNAHRVFQTLNAGGKPLRQADLVRNYFFLLLGDAGDEFYHAHWQLLEADLPARELEEYFVAWTIAQGYTGAKQSLFRYFQKDLASAEEDTAAVLEYGRTLTTTARQFQWIRKPDDSPLRAAKVKLKELKFWGTVPAEGLVLLLLRKFSEGKLDDLALARTLEFILSFMARRMLAGFEPQLHKDIFVRAAQRIGARKELEGQDLVDFLHFTLSRGSDVRSWPATELVIERATSNSLYTAPRSHWVKSILIRAAEAMKQPNEVVPPPAALRVEHVMPGSLSAVWADQLVSWGIEHPAGLHQLRAQVLGNMTLVDNGAPPDSDATFDQQKARLRATAMTINSAIYSSTRWTGSEIDARSAALASQICVTYTAPMDAEAMRNSKFAGSPDDTAATDPEVDEEA